MPTIENTTLYKLESLYKSDYRTLVGFAFLFVATKEVAEEIVQDVFLLTIKKAQTDENFYLNEPDKYIKKAIVLRSRNYHRRNFLKKKKEDQLQKQITLVTNDKPKESDAIDRAIAMLPRSQKECIILRYFEDMKIEEIAGTLSISEGTVKSNLNRASAAIKSALDAIAKEETK